MATGRELKKLSLSRLKSAKILMDADDFDGAIYLMLHSLEIALKAVICKHLQFKQYPDKGDLDQIKRVFHTHDREVLLRLSGLKPFFSPVHRSKLRYRNWNKVITWDFSMRYSPSGTAKKKDAERVYDALTKENTGVIEFIKTEGKW